MSTNENTTERDRLIDVAIEALTDRERTVPSRDDIAVIVDAVETSITMCGCAACTTARRERVRLTDHERTALARALHGLVYAPGADFDRSVPGIQEYMLGCADKVAAALPWLTPEDTRPVPPVYLAADLWDALGAPTGEFDAYYERNGWADTWANVLGAVRDRFKPKCGQDVDGESCVLSAGHLPPHYGASDVGRSEPVPAVEPQGEPSDALDLDRIEALAKAATSGPWMLDGMGEDEPQINYWAHRFIGTAEPNASGSHEIIATSEDGHGPNAAYIAAVDPQTVLALIAALRAAGGAR